MMYGTQMPTLVVYDISPACPDNHIPTLSDGVLTQVCGQIFADTGFPNGSRITFFSTKAVRAGELIPGSSPILIVIKPRLVPAELVMSGQVCPLLQIGGVAQIDENKMGFANFILLRCSEGDARKKQMMREVLAAKDKLARTPGGFIVPDVDLTVRPSNSPALR